MAKAVARSLSILHVVDSLERGGLEHMASDLAIAQHRAGHAVKVFCLYRTGGLAAVLEAEGIEVLCAAKQAGIDWGAIGQLRAAITRHGVDIVHAQNIVPNYYAALALFAHRGGAVLVDTCHDMGTRLSNRKLRWLFAWSLRRTARVAMVGGPVFDKYVGDGMVRRERAKVIVNGINVQRFSGTPPRRAAARAALNLSHEACVLGCVGRLVELKNHRLVVQALPDIARHYPAVKLVLLGGGVEEGALRAQAEAAGVTDRILFAGERTDVGNLLPAFDVFLLPSKTEGRSIALLEAAATALPLVATAVGGNPEIVSDGHTGLLIPSDDANALTAAVLRLLGDATLRHRLGAAAADWVRANAAVEAMRDEYDSLYRAALASS